jgi:hypothetical protein
MTMANEEEEFELPPAFVQFQQQLKEDRKKLMRDKAYGASPEQLRAFVGTHMFQRLDEMMTLVGIALYDTYSLAVSSENQIQRMRAVYGGALAKLGADVADEKGDLPGVSPDLLDDLQQHFYALGTLLQKKLPDDKEVQAAFNKVAQDLAEVTAELMGGAEDDEDEEDEKDEGEEEEAKAKKNEESAEDAGV